MKRTFIMIMTVVLVIALCCTSVFAAGSKTDIVEIISAVDLEGNDVAVTETDTSIPWLTEEIAASKDEVPEAAKELCVLYQKDLTSETLPVIITFKVEGLDGEKLYVFHHNGTDWEVITEGVGPTVEATFTSLSPVAVVSAVKTTEGGGEQSPTTGSTMGIFVACGIAAAACVGSIAVVRKKD